MHVILPAAKTAKRKLQLVADGSSNQAIADKLGIALRTVKKHLEQIYEKLGADSRTSAVARARMIGSYSRLYKSFHRLTP